MYLKWASHFLLPIQNFIFSSKEFFFGWVVCPGGVGPPAPSPPWISTSLGANRDGYCTKQRGEGGGFAIGDHSETTSRLLAPSPQVSAARFSFCLTVSRRQSFFGGPAGDPARPFSDPLFDCSDRLAIAMLPPHWTAHMPEDIGGFPNVPHTVSAGLSWHCCLRTEVTPQGPQTLCCLICCGAGGPIWKKLPGVLVARL